MKILIDVPVDENALAQLRASVPCEIDCLVPPAEKARDKDRLWDIFRLNVERYARGEPLLNELTPAQLAGA